jgi:hypothetical protein
MFELNSTLRFFAMATKQQTYAHVHRHNRQMSRMQFKWMQQNRYEIEELYIVLKRIRDSHCSTFLSNLTYDSVLNFVLANSQSQHPNPYLPIHAACPDTTEETDVAADEESAHAVLPQSELSDGNDQAAKRFAHRRPASS